MAISMTKIEEEVAELKQLQEFHRQRESMHRAGEATINVTTADQACRLWRLSFKYLCYTTFFVTTPLHVSTN
jgi:hypothetical protein